MSRFQQQRSENTTLHHDVSIVDVHAPKQDWISWQDECWIELLSECSNFVVKGQLSADAGASFYLSFNLFWCDIFMILNWHFEEKKSRNIAVLTTPSTFVFINSFSAVLSYNLLRSKFRVQERRNCRPTPRMASGQHIPRSILGLSKQVCVFPCTSDKPDLQLAYRLMQFACNCPPRQCRFSGSWLRLVLNELALQLCSKHQGLDHFVSDCWTCWMSCTKTFQHQHPKTKKTWYSLFLILLFLFWCPWWRISCCPEGRQGLNPHFVPDFFPGSWPDTDFQWPFFVPGCQLENSMSKKTLLKSFDYLICVAWCLGQTVLHTAPTC